jgi:putative DNA primase/helicase
MVHFEGRWKRDVDKAVWRQMEKFRKQLLLAASKTPDRKAEDAARERAGSLGKTQTIRNVLAIAESNARVVLGAEEINSDPWRVGARNAVIDLRSGEARAHSRDCYITKTLAADFKEGARCVRWLAFVAEVFPDPEVARYVWKAVGYSLTGSVEEKVFFFMYGRGNNGKTRFAETIFKILGEYAKKASDQILQVSPHGGEPQLAKAEIYGARFLSCSEIKEDSRLNEKLIKDITGGDTIRGRYLYQHSFDFSLYGNHKPSVKGTDDAMWDRVCVIPFLQKFEGAAADKKLEGKLLAEKSGILNWMIEGCLLWQKEGLEMPPAITGAVREYRSDQDIIGSFLEEKTRASHGGFAMHGDLFRTYGAWADEQGLKYKLSSRALAKLLRERPDWEERKDAHGSPMWLGVELKGKPA